MSGSGGGTNTSNTVAQFTPPSYTVAPWQNYTSTATGLDSQGLPIYTGQTVAAPSQQQQVGTDQLTSLATQGNPFMDTASATMQDMLQGNNANPYATAANPYIGNNQALDQYVNLSNQQLSNSFADTTAAQTDAKDAMAGAYGGSAAQEAQNNNQNYLQNQVAMNTNNLLGQNYSQSANLAQQGIQNATQAYTQGQQMQLQAAGLVPSYNQAQSGNIENMMNAGQQNVQGYQQNLLNAASSLFSQYQQAPWNLQSLLGGDLAQASGQGGTSTSSVFNPMSLMQGLLGGSAVGAGLYNAVGG